MHFLVNISFVLLNNQLFYFYFLLIVHCVFIKYYFQYLSDHPSIQTFKHQIIGKPKDILKFWQEEIQKLVGVVSWQCFYQTNSSLLFVDFFYSLFLFFILFFFLFSFLFLFSLPPFFPSQESRILKLRLKKVALKLHLSKMQSLTNQARPLLTLQMTYQAERIQNIKNTTFIMSGLETPRG